MLVDILLTYPIGIKKALLLSPAGYNIPGTRFYKDSKFGFFCAQACCPSCVWPFRVRLQKVYKCCCCHNFIKKHYGIHSINFDELEIRKNDDGTPFKVDKNKLLGKIKELTILTLEYPKDLYRFLYYLFKPPPPAAHFPIEKKLMSMNKIPIIFTYGDKDWMDKIGAYRLCKYVPLLYKVFTINNSGHSFAIQNPKDLCAIIGQ